MYFDEGRVLNQSHYNDPEVSSYPNSSQAQLPGQSCRCLGSRAAESNSPSGEKQTAEMLDSANNRLQELMQLLYLLSRDPGVPSDARYHVTMAQGEIALLARVMRNTAENEGQTGAESDSKVYRAAHP